MNREMAKAFGEYIADQCVDFLQLLGVEDVTIFHGGIIAECGNKGRIR